MKLDFDSRPLINTGSQGLVNYSEFLSHSQCVLNFEQGVLGKITYMNLSGLSGNKLLVQQLENEDCEWEEE